MAYRQTLESTATRLDNPPLLPPPSTNSTGTVKGRGLGMQGNTYPRYRTPEALQFAVDLYFDTLGTRPPTMAGMALSLGFRSRQSLKNYEERNDGYAEVVETARTRVEQYKNELILDPNMKSVHGVLFDLKNCHGWADKTETKVEVSAAGSLEDLLRQLQGNVLRPVIESTATTLPSIEDLI